ncbi:hypothetical protein GLX_04410 [Komagataeibacter medellinensis NBRC 3288]|uniref:S-adenosyl-L-methionine-dependent methyltransferase n=2 Tax=Komagataeibacter medellinensis TaxID=1177712 RepID=G2I406_KOMMN|nr:hypothetical protein GLX_04410 [Komagataeibacter medellinensis NBRC 3288]
MPHTARGWKGDVTMDCPSVTAWRVARHRARHQVLEKGAVFADPLAIAMVGGDEAALAAPDGTPAERHFRLFLAIRSRIVQDMLARAVQRGMRQAVVLGAGLDTLGLRNPHAACGVRVFEVDRPAMQDWKRGHIARAGLAVPDSLAFVPVDFERDSLLACLAHAGFDVGMPAFFSWLGVVPYLTRVGIENTLRFVARVPQAEIVFDYGEPVENYTGAHALRMAERARFVALAGEPWLSRFNPTDLHAMLRDTGFATFTDYDRAGIAAYFGWPVPAATGAGPHVVVAHARQGCAVAGPER